MAVGLSSEEDVGLEKTPPMLFRLVHVPEMSGGPEQAGRPDLDLSATGGQIVDTIVKLLCDEEASQAWNR